MTVRPCRSVSARRSTGLLAARLDHQDVANRHLRDVRDTGDVRKREVEDRWLPLSAPLQRPGQRSRERAADAAGNRRVEPLVAEQHTVVREECVTALVLEHVAPHEDSREIRQLRLRRAGSKRFVVHRPDDTGRLQRAPRRARAGPARSRRGAPWGRRISPPTSNQQPTVAVFVAFWIWPSAVPDVAAWVLKPSVAPDPRMCLTPRSVPRSADSVPRTRGPGR